MSGYEPRTGEIRTLYADSTGSFDEFDAWLERVKREAGAAALREAAEAHSPGGMTIGYHGQFAHDLRERADRIERGE